MRTDVKLLIFVASLSSHHSRPGTHVEAGGANESNSI